MRVASIEKAWLWLCEVNAGITHGIFRSIKKQAGITNFRLHDMRRFYLEYRDYPNLRQLVAEIPWGQNLLILSKIKLTEICEYYIKSTIELGWTRDVLRLQINSGAYERHQLPVKQNNFQQVLPQHLAEQANQAMKDIYMLDTLGISQPILEIELEKRMVVLENGLPFVASRSEAKNGRGDRI